MAKNATSFTKATAPKGKGASKHKKTKIKEAIGLNGWENLCDYIKTDGSKKLQEEMAKLKGKDFVMAFSTLVEFVKPKLSRTTLETDKDKPFEITINGKNPNA